MKMIHRHQALGASAIGAMLPGSAVAQIAGDLSGMHAQEIAAVNVVLQCLLCPSFSECETARELVQEPLLLVDYDQETRI